VQGNSAALEFCGQAAPGPYASRKCAR